MQKAPVRGILRRSLRKGKEHVQIKMEKRPLAWTLFHFVDGERYKRCKQIQWSPIPNDLQEASIGKNRSGIPEDQCCIFAASHLPELIHIISHDNAVCQGNIARFLQICAPQHTLQNEKVSASVNPEGHSLITNRIVVQRNCTFRMGM